jgi:urocanate reductase
LILSSYVTAPGNALAPFGCGKLPTSWDTTVDVIVIGSGFAGCAAAAAAAEAGSTVAVLEKMPQAGGNSAINLGDFAAWDSSLKLRQKHHLGEDSAVQHATDILRAGEGYSDPVLARALAEGAPAALDWMIERGGLKLRDHITRQGLFGYRMHHAASGCGIDYVDALHRIAGQHGARFYVGHTVMRLLRAHADAPIAGIEVQTADGMHRWHARRAIVIASGGFSADVAMRKIFRPILTDAYNNTNHPGATGEVIRCAQAIGAEVLHLEFIEVHPCGDPATGALDAATSCALQVRRSGAMLVAKNGRRFVNEFASHDFVARQEIATGAKPTFTICNQAQLNAEPGRTELPELIQQGRILRAEALRELAARAGIDPAALEETAQRYAQALRERKDPDFNRPISADTVAFETGPWYAIPNWPSVHHTMGGLRIDSSARVMDILGRPIPRLYAAGEVTGGIHGAVRLGGNSSAAPVVFGRIAGKCAAAEPAA